jgi:hypothetical protein
MAAIGQAEANARLVADQISGAGLPPGSRILFAGCGPGQMFDFVSTDFLRPFSLTFTDINPEFIEVICRRALDAGLDDSRAVLDDAEAPGVKGPFELAVLVLVLEHLDWKKCLAAQAVLPTRQFLVVIQKNPEGLASNVSPHRELPGSLALASQGESAHLLEEAELLDEFSSLGFELLRTDFRAVADGKEMRGYWFCRRDV